jgi:hypothetical protein
LSAGDSDWSPVKISVVNSERPRRAMNTQLGSLIQILLGVSQQLAPSPVAFISLDRSRYAVNWHQIAIFIEPCLRPARRTGHRQFRSSQVPEDM